MNALKFIFPVILFLLFTSKVQAQWQWSNPTNAPFAVNAVVFANNLFVAVGDDGGVKTSFDGKQWFDYSAPTQFALNGIAWNGNRYVAVGGVNISNRSAHVILSSSDGRNWDKVKNGDGTPLNAVASNSSLFVAVGRQVVMRSEDGQNWTRLDTPLAGNYTDIFWDGSRFIVVGDGGKIMTSVNGEQWVDVESALIDENNLNSIAWDGNLYVVAADNGNVYTSTDLTDWYRAGVSGSTSSNVEVMWSNAISAFVLLVTGAEGPAIYTSSDGDTWKSSSPVNQPAFYALAENSSSVLAMGENGEAFTSTDGRFWEQPVRAVVQRADLSAVIWAEGQYVAVGMGEAFGNGASAQIWTSQDAVKWQSFNNAGNFRRPIVDIAYNGALFVTVSGIKNSKAAIYRSADLENWVLSDKNSFPGNSVRGMNAVVWDGRQFIGVGAQNNMAVSADGVKWNRVDLNSLGIRNVNFNNIYVDGSQLIALGRQYLGEQWVGAILTSTDNGKNWQSQNSNTSSGLYDIASNGEVYVAVGGDNVSNVNGEQVILSSPDLVNWTERESGVSGALKSIVWDGKQFIVPVSDLDPRLDRPNLSGGVITSVNGENWVFNPIPGAVALNAVVEKSGQVVMVGNGSQILRKGERRLEDEGGDVIDTIAPVVTPPNDITIDAGTGNEAIVVRISHPDIIRFLANATATDNVAVVGGVKNDAPNEFISSATTTVTFTAVDAAGNEGTATAKVTILNGLRDPEVVGLPVGAPVGGVIVSEQGGSASLSVWGLGLLFFVLLFARRRSSTEKVSALFAEQI